jgi:hypothetical protein
MDKHEHGNNKRRNDMNKVREMQTAGPEDPERNDFRVHQGKTGNE